MVFLTVTPAAATAIEEYRKIRQDSSSIVPDENEDGLGDQSKPEIGSPIEHSKLIEISAFLLKRAQQGDESALGKEWRLDALLKGASIYQAPPPPRPETVSADTVKTQAPSLTCVDF